MRLTGSALVAALFSIVVPASSAHAVTCPLLTDRAGDGTVQIVGVVSSPKLDIVSADIASGATTVAVALRLAEWPAVDPVTLKEARWQVFWMINNSTYRAGYRTTGSTTLHVNDVSRGPVTAVVNEAAATITWTIPRGLLPDLSTAGQTFREIHAFSWVDLGTILNADTANTTQVYVDKAPGCIPAS